MPGARSVMKGSAKLGAEGPILSLRPVLSARLRKAATTATMQAQMLSYSRSKSGVFGGVSLSGTSLAPDNDDNEELLCRKKVSGRSDPFPGEPYRRLHPLRA